MKVEIKIPNLGESITEATVCNIIKENGSFVEMDDEVIELETEKVNQTLNAPESGKLEISVKVDDVVKVGQVIGFVDTEDKEGKKPESKEEKKAETAVQEKKEEPSEKPAEPAKEKPVQGNAKIRESEAEFLTSINQVQKEENKLSKEETQKPKAGSEREVRSRMTKLRKIVAEKLVRAKNETAMLTTFNEVDMEKIIEFRAKEQASFLKKHEVKLGFMSFFIKASILALKKYPEINAYIDKDEIVYQKYYDIGIAVGTEKGLFVPVIRNADQMSFVEIEKRLKELAEKARTYKISIDDLRGGSFTITNGGTYGSLLSTPILNPPQSGILGMHAIQKRCVVIDDKIVIKPMMYLALSYDHRIVDGEEAIGFLVEIKNHLEDPTRILVDL